ncbi:MAG: isocitrate/isopropylmalate family dehydrogenase [Robiginitomaculum sp.]|nr:isocitrate/isopropylmalate family dehydrogenase [Robiginitomaculum sp.]
MVLPGDGVGPEVTEAAIEVLVATAEKFGFSLEFDGYAFGGAAIDACGEPLPDDTLAACKEADAIFLGAVGGPKWGVHTKRPEAGLLGLRSALNLFANLRPVKLHPALAAHSPLKEERIKGVDILILRELTGGLYFGEKKREADKASDLCEYSKFEIIRATRVAFEAAVGGVIMSPPSTRPMCWKVAVYGAKRSLPCMKKIIRTWNCATNWSIPRR